MNNRGSVQSVQKAARLVERAKKRGAPVEEGGNREDGDREEENGEATIVVARPIKRVKAAKAVFTVPRRSGRVLRK
jgi:hypothetical protein